MQAPCSHLFALSTAQGWMALRCLALRSLSAGGWEVKGMFLPGASFHEQYPCLAM